jgi:hypothetical protein
MVHDAEAELGLGVARLGRPLEPFEGLGVVDRDAIALEVHGAEAELGLGVAGLGGLLKQLQA